jgi:hypothetical protein
LTGKTVVEDEGARVLNVTLADSSTPLQVIRKQLTLNVKRS